MFGLTMNKWFFVSAFLLVSMCASPVQAELIVTFGPIADLGTPLPSADNDTAFGVFAPGDTVTLPVLAHLSAGSADVDLDNISIPIDFFGDGFEVINPSGPNNNMTGDPGDGNVFRNVSFSAGDFATNLFNVNPVPFVLPGNTFDFGISLSGTTVTVTDDLLNPVTLFNLVFDVAPMAPTGIYDVIRNATGNSSSNTVFSNGSVPFTDFTFDNGQIEVLNSAAVPEPGTFALMALGLFGYGWQKRRKA